MSVPCDILLSVYGDAPYLPQFLESLRAQRDRDWRLVYRFDGEPAAATAHLLAAVDNSVEIPGRVHLGVVGSYRELLRASDADCFFLADQDDVWHPDKLPELLAELTAQERCFGVDVPLLIHSDLRIVDRAGREIAPSFVRYQSLDPSRCSLRDLLVQNNVTGCALMGNRALREVTGTIPDAVICHDWYLSLVAAAFGRIVFVDRPLVDYRQHGGNVIGAVLRRRFFTAGISWAALRDRLNETQRQAAAFLNQLGERLTIEQRELVSAWVGMTEVPHYLVRLWIAFKYEFRKNDWLRTIGMVAAL